MSSLIARNEAFLRNIYNKGPFEGHAFCLHAASTPIHSLEHGDYTLSDRPVSEWVPWIVDNYRRQLDVLEAAGDDSVPTAKLSTGTHIYAAAFGCPVHLFEESNSAALPLVRTAREADALPEPDIWKQPVLYRVFELGDLVRNELGTNFYFGPCDVQSGFDTACLIWNKQDFFMAMMDEEEAPAAERLIQKCARLLKTFLLELRREFPNMSPCHCPAAWAPPERAPWLSNDECGAVNNETYRRFIQPELLDLAETFGGLGVHCCADAEHQFPLFNEVPGFYAFNRVPARRGWDPILEHFGGPEAPVHVISWISDADIRRLIDNAPVGTRFIFVRDVTHVDQGRRWLDDMRAHCPRTDSVTVAG